MAAAFYLRSSQNNPEVAGSETTHDDGGSDDDGGTVSSGTAPERGNSSQGDTPVVQHSRSGVLLEVDAGGAGLPLPMANPAE